MQTQHIIALTLFFLVTACSSSDSSSDKAPPAQQAQQAAEQPGGSIQNLAQGFQQMAKGVQQLAGGTNPETGEPVEAVHFRELKAWLPEIGGWSKGDESGEMMKMPLPHSQAEASYTRGDEKVEVKVIDSAMAMMMVQPFAMMMSSGFERESDKGYEKSTKLGNYPAWEKWDNRKNKAELNVLVGKRFMLKIEGRGLKDPKTIAEIASKLDLEKLVSLKSLSPSQPSSP